MHDGNTNSRETMWAEMKPYCYGGETCDQVEPRWHIYCEGDKDSEDTHEPLALDARTFPPGTKITITEPTCPNCGDLRYPTFPGPPSGKPPAFKAKCECGFDWEAWTLNEYS